MGEVGVGIYAAVAEEGPDFALSTDLVQIHFCVEDFFVGSGSLRDEGSAGVRYKTTPPELDTRAAIGASWPQRFGAAT